MDGSEGESAQRCRSFAEKLQNKTQLPVTLRDERGTTITAHGYLNSTDTRGKKRKSGGRCRSSHHYITAKTIWIFAEIIKIPCSRKNKIPICFLKRADGFSLCSK